MSAFGGLILTNKGRNLQAKAQTGVQLNFTRISVGDGDLAGASILDLNALKHEVKSLAITKLKTITGGKAVVGTVFSNETILFGFYWRELGVFAQDPDIGEILYCYGNAGVNAEYIPAGGGPDIIEKSIDVVTIVGNAANVTATIESSLVYVSAQDFDLHTGNNVAHVTQIDRDGWDAKETPAGAQAKADVAAATGVAAANVVQGNLTAHKADDAKRIKVKQNITILATGWVDDTANSGYWKYDIVDADIFADTVVDVNIHLADLEKASSLKSANVSSSGKVTLYADAQPTEEMLCDLKLIRQVV